MAQAPAYSDEIVVETALAMRASGVEPTRAALWRKLGARGQPNTAWEAWLRHRDRQAPVNGRVYAESASASSELATSIQHHHAALEAVISRVRFETAAPLNRRIAALEGMLEQETAEKADMAELIDAMSQELEDRDRRLAEGDRAGRPRLILP